MQSDPTPATPVPDTVEAVAELQLAAFLAGRGSVTSMKHGTRSAKPGPTMDDYRRLAQAALTACRAQVEQQERDRIVAWLREDAGWTASELRRLHARKALTPAMTGNWEAIIKTKVGIADAITRHEHRSADNG